MGVWPAIAAATEVTLAWDPCADPEVTGYRVYYGTASRSYTSSVQVSLTNAVTISGLVPGREYFFAATSFIDLGLESPYSEEASYRVPAPNQPPTLAPIRDITLNQNAGQTTVLLTGITSGSANEDQTLTVTAASSNPGVIPNPRVNYASPSTIGSLTVAPVPAAVGTAASPWPSMTANPLTILLTSPLRSASSRFHRRSSTSSPPSSALKRVSLLPFRRARIIA